MTAPACDCRRLLLVPERGAPPSASNWIGVCQDCGEFHLHRTQGNSTVHSTFRLTARHLKALGQTLTREARR